jgi:hypothetical protein
MCVDHRPPQSRETCWWECNTVADWLKVASISVFVGGTKPEDSEKSSITPSVNVTDAFRTHRHLKLVLILESLLAQRHPIDESSIP